MSKLLEILEEKLGKEVFTEEVVKDVKAEIDVLVNEKVIAEKNIIEEKAASEKKVFEEKIISEYRQEADQYKEELVEQIDSYLDYAAKEFLIENKIAIESEFKVKCAEELIESICGVLEGNHFKVTPATDKVIKSITEKNKKIEQKLNEVIKENIKVRKECNEYKKALRFKKLTEGLSQSKIEKVMDLLEGLEFSDMKDFDRKVKIIVEKVSKPVNETITEKKEVLQDKFEKQFKSDIDKYLD